MALMTTMRNKLHFVMWALLILFLLSMTVGGLVGGANIIDEILGNVNPRDAIGVVDGEKISPQQFSQLVSDQLDQIRNSGQELGDGQIDAIRSQVWDNLVREILVSQAVKELGLTATDNEVVYHLQNNPPPFLRSNPAFLTEGTFDLSKYNQAISNPQGNEWVPIEQFMKNNYIPNYKLQQMIRSSVSISEEEVWDEYIKRYVDYTINAIHITNKAFDEETLRPTEDELKDSYKEQIDKFEQPEKRVLRFVTWKKEPSAVDSIDVYNEALEIKQRALKGENFTVLANTYTEDPGNQVTPDSGRGGDLGWFGRGQMVPPFDQAAFDAEAGEIVGPIFTNFGYHIIRIIDKKTENNKEQVNAAHILMKISISPRTQDELRHKATQFSYDAQDYGFDAALDTHAIEARKADPIDEEATYIPGIGIIRSAVRFAFNRDIGEVSDPLENNDHIAIFKLDSIIPPGPTSFEELNDRLLSELTRERVIDAAKKLAEDFAQRVDQGESFESLLAENDKLEQVENDTKKLNRGFKSIGRSNYVTGALLQAKIGEMIGPLRTIRGYTLIKVSNIQEIDSTDFEIKKNVLKNDLLSTKQNQAFTDWLQALKEKAEITDNRKYHF